jgi:hypothetical protein
MRLHQHHLKINLDKCLFGDKQVSYLGFSLTPEGINPGEAKLKAIKNPGPPNNVKEIRSFMGLCNFFRNHMPDFASTAAPLVLITGAYPHQDLGDQLFNFGGAIEPMQIPARTQHTGTQMKQSPQNSWKTYKPITKHYRHR